MDGVQDQAVSRPSQVDQRPSTSTYDEKKPAGQQRFCENAGRSAETRDKILDIFEGTQQIQQLIVARRLLGRTSAQLK
ncbi:hypothetical protein ACFQ1S_40350 [Kibdelosporangium lantanae]|uniref:Uncharacterized protein n=1 Tax=Kibdelosporangium lantanae TaxID=1497396 RepID=A0ABW3MLQ8_9PSEU